MAVLSATATRHTTTARRRCKGWRSGFSGRTLRRRASAASSTSSAPGTYPRRASPTRPATILTGRRLPGYCENRAFCSRIAARSLARVATCAAATRPLVRDAYRPARASRAPCAGPSERPRRPRRHLHRPPQPPQHRQRRRPTPCGRTAAARPDGDGPRQPPHARTRRTRPAAPWQPPDPRARDAALRLQPLLREWWHFEHSRSGSRYLDEPIGC